MRPSGDGFGSFASVSSPPGTGYGVGRAVMRVKLGPLLGFSEDEVRSAMGSMKRRLEGVRDSGGAWVKYD